MKGSFKDNVKLLPDELTDVELEQVVGGRQDDAFQEWRVKIVNNLLHAVILYKTAQLQAVIHSALHLQYNFDSTIRLLPLQAHDRNE